MGQGEGTLVKPLMPSTLVGLALALGFGPVAAVQIPQQAADEASAAAANYQRYCSLCHGENREGYVNDHAPSPTTTTTGTSLPWPGTCRGTGH
jgi:mono/diheme cytochrome c family protein